VWQVLRVLASDADLLRFLYDTYDGKGGTTLVRDLVIVLARHVHSALQLGEGMEEILQHMSAMFAQKVTKCDRSVTNRDGSVTKCDRNVTKM
jgi:hypothetical protein